MRFTTVGIVLSVALVFSVPAFAQIYKYTDQNGIVRYTDDPAQVKDVDPDSVKTMEEIKTSTKAYPNSQTTSVKDKNPRSVEIGSPDRVSDTQDNSSGGIGNATQDKSGKVKEGLDIELSAIKALNDHLQEEKTRLKSPPPESASDAEKRNYQQQVLNLNTRIEAYQKRVEAHRQKVKGFNGVEIDKAAP